MKSISFFSILFFTFILTAQDSNYVKSGKVDIFYRTMGEGKPILIINGGPGFNSEGFQEIAQELSSLGYQTILYDQRGTGRSKMSTMDSSNITMDLMTHDIEVIRKDLSIKQWIIFGHSFGGMMANYYATKHPDKIRAIIHSSSGGIDLSLLEAAQEGVNNRLTTSEIDSMNYWMQKYRQSDDPGDRMNFNRFFARAYVYHEQYVPKVAARMMQGDMGINRLVWSDLIRIEFDAKPQLKSFEKPVLILQGEEDILQASIATQADSIFPNSKLVFLPQCGHYGWLDNPSDYLSAIKEFLLQIEKEDIENTVEKYVKAIYTIDSNLVSEVANSTLQKSGHYWSKRNKNWSYHNMNFEELKETASTYNQKDWLPKWAPNQVEIFDVNQKVASAKVKAIWGFDYVLLSKDSKGKWWLNKVLWQSYTEKEAQQYFTVLKEELEK